MKPYGSYVAARTLYDGAVRTMRGMDRLTGMPVLIYTLPAPQEAPHLLSRRLVPYSDQGWEQGTYFLVAELPLHAVPAGDPLLAARGALEALTELHAGGQVHGGLTPAQLWAVDSDVRLAGAGLPWGPLSSGFEAPEGGKSPQADLYALGCTLEALGGVPDALRGLLSPDPQARPSAREALALLNAPPAANEPAPGERLELPDEPPAAQAVTPPEEAPPVVVGEPPAPFPTIRMGFEEQAGGATSAPAPAAPLSANTVPANSVPAKTLPIRPVPAGGEPTAPNPRQAPIRIGWEEDHSWRVVRAPEEEAEAARPASRARAAGLDAGPAAGAAAGGRGAVVAAGRRTAGGGGKLLHGGLPGAGRRRAGEHHGAQRAERQRPGARRPARRGARHPAIPRHARQLHPEGRGRGLLPHAVHGVGAHQPVGRDRPEEVEGFQRTAFSRQQEAGPALAFRLTAEGLSSMSECPS